MLFPLQNHSPSDKQVQMLHQTKDQLHRPLLLPQFHRDYLMLLLLKTTQQTYCCRYHHIAFDYLYISNNHQHFHLLYRDLLNQSANQGLSWNHSQRNTLMDLRLNQKKHNLPPRLLLLQQLHHSRRTMAHEGYHQSFYFA